MTAKGLNSNHGSAATQRHQLGFTFCLECFLFFFLKHLLQLPALTFLDPPSFKIPCWVSHLLGFWTKKGIRVCVGPVKTNVRWSPDVLLFFSPPFLLLGDTSKVPGAWRRGLEAATAVSSQDSLSQECMGSACKAWLLSIRFLKHLLQIGKLLAGCVTLHAHISP